MWFQVGRYLFGPKWTPSYDWRLVDSEVKNSRFEIALEGENLITEAGQVVGKTAVIDIGEGHISQTAGRIPSGYQISLNFS
jgi:hypothetical protein